MKTVSINGFISVRPSIYGKDEYNFFSCKMDDHGYITIMPHTVDVEIPDTFNLVASKVEALKAKKENLRKEFDLRVKAINEEISKLQCLEFTPAEAA